jgi:TPR repeat protein
MEEGPDMPTVGHAYDRCDFVSRMIRRHRGIAMVLVMGFLAGAALCVVLWNDIALPVRQAKLAGFVGVRPSAEQLRDSVEPSNWLAVGQLLLACGGLLGAAVFAGPLARRLSRAAAWTLVVLALARFAESQLVNGPPPGPDDDVTAIPIQGIAFVEFTLVPCTVAIALAGAVTTVLRLAGRVQRPPDPPPPDDASGAEGDDANWRTGFSLPPGREAPVVPNDLGICLSGGGIRSATFSLGALQALQARPSLAGGDGPELTRARYLTAVSGGAYTAGAFLLATEPPRPDPRAPKRPRAPYGLDWRRAFGPGSPELDHLRRHSSYIADGLREWMVAVLVVLRGAAVATLFLALVAVVTGRWAGHLYWETRRYAVLADPWQPLWGGAFAVAVVAVLAAGVWMLSVVTWVSPRIRPGFAEASVIISIALAALVLIGAGVPIVTWASSMMIQSLTDVAAPKVPAAGKAGILGAIGVATTALGLLGRRRAEVAKAVRAGTGNWLRRLGDFGQRVVQWLAVLVGLAFVLSVYLMIFGYATSSTALTPTERRPWIGWGSPDWQLPLTNIQLTIAMTAGLLTAYFFVDETATGLHPFYRRRLASAFAVRRVPDMNAPGGYLDKPYEWEETTDLHHYKGRHPPQVIFCASAHCSDPEFTPPGRHVLPYTLSYDFIGGPDVGWASVAELRTQPWGVSRRLAKDLTVQTAMAVSGGAFASATGAARVPANLILALTNARLGTWLPTPVPPYGQTPSWWTARTPRWRRMSYLIREIFAWHPRGFPMLFVTDGAHYESLGLVELLRHRPAEVYCFDATMDTGAFGRSIARSVALAYDELGVTIILDDPELAQPATARGGGAGAADSAAGKLAARLAETPIVTGRITYPARADDPSGEERHATLVIGMAVLCRDMPWEVRQHAIAHPLFPHDATGDQWFDDKKFNAYTALGRFVGGLAVDAMAARRPDGEAPSPTAPDPLADTTARAKAGDVPAMRDLGLHLAELRLEGGRRWLERAARAGDEVAAYRLGVLLATSDEPAARYWYEQAAGNGSLRAMYNLGALFTESDPEQACRWYARAARAGHVKAMFNLGLLYATSQTDSVRAHATARHWFRKAAAAGDTRAMTNLAMLIRHSDLDAAIALSRRAAEAGRVVAMHNLVLLLHAGQRRAAKKAEEADTRAERRAKEKDAKEAAAEARLWWEQAAARGGPGPDLLSATPTSSWLPYDEGFRAGFVDATRQFGKARQTPSEPSPV